jgi:hypothetical protein
MTVDELTRRLVVAARAPALGQHVLGFETNYRNFKPIAI